MRHRFLAALLAALMAAALPGAAVAAKPPVFPLLIAQKENTVGLEEAVQRVEERTGGRVLAARTVRRPDGTFHLVRVLVDKGRVRVFKVNARTGAVD